MRLKSTPRFDRAYRKMVRRHRHQQCRIDDALRLLALDLGTPSLQTHKLSGNLAGLWACSCGYDCRIVFLLAQDGETGEEFIVLIDLGTHDEIY